MNLSQIVSKFFLLLVILVNFSIIGLLIGDNLIVHEKIDDNYYETNNGDKYFENKLISEEMTETAVPSELFSNQESKPVAPEKSFTGEIIKYPDVSSRYTYVNDGTGVIEHYVDQISDVDSTPDKGTHDIFSDLLATDDTFDNITESIANITLINGESFENNWPPSSWGSNGAWNQELNRAIDGFYSADFDGPDGSSNLGYLTSPVLDMSDATSIFIEFYYYDENLDSGEFALDLFDGLSWDIDYADLDQDPEDQWNFFSTEISDSQYFKSNFQVRWFADPRSDTEHAYVDLVTIKKEVSTELNLEVQFTDVAHFMGNQTLAIKTGIFSGIENLSLSYWNGLSWSVLGSELLATAWNNFSILITSNNFNIKFEGSSMNINWWEIDSALIRLEGSGSNIYPVQSDSSNVDSSLDKGSIQNFNSAKIVDTFYANFQEDASGTANTYSVDLTGGYLSSSSSDHTSTSGTLSYWIKYDTVSGRPYGLDGNMETRISGSSLSLDWGSTGTIVSSATFTAEIWYFNAITWNENQNKLLFYSSSAGSEPSLDANSLQGSWVSSVSNIIFTNVFWGNGKGANAPIDGHFDDLRYYDTDRSLNDILNDYNKSLIGTEPNLINYYKMDNDYLDYVNTDDLTGVGSQLFSSDTPPWELGISNNQLDQELQWNEVAHFLDEETLAIKTGVFNADESLLVDFWNGTVWNTLFTELSANSWNNISINNYLNSATFTIRFRDANTSILDNSWLIDAILIHVNTPDIPRLSNIIISPLNPNSTVDLTLGYNYFDYQSDPENLSLREVQWFKNNNYEPVYDNLDNLTQLATTKGESWFARIRVSDGQNYSKWVNSTIVQIGNSIPSATNIIYNVTQADTNTPFEIQYIYYDPDVDVENKSQIIVYWIINGFYNSSYDNQTIIYPSNTTLGNFFSYQIRIFDGTNYSQLLQSNFGMGISGGANTLPIVSSLEILPINPQTSADLMSNYTFFDGDFHPEAGSLIKWFKNVTGTITLESLYNDFKILPSSATNKGELWHFEVTPKDLFDFGIPINSSPYEIINSIPLISDIQVPQNPVNTTTILANWTYTDLDNDAPTYNITWYKNGVYQPFYNNKTQFNSTDHRKNDVIQYQIQVFDGENYSTTNNSSFITILNSVPIVSNIQISPGFDTLYANNSLDVSWQYFDIDTDSENSSLVLIFWYLDFNLYSSLNNSLSVPSNLVNKGDRWSVEVSVYDGFDYSLKRSFGPVVIQNSLSVLSNIFLNGNLTEINASVDLTLTRDFSDINNGDFAFFQNITWYLLSENQSSWIYKRDWDNQSILSSIFLNKSQKWYVQISVYDSDDWTLIYRSNNITIINSLPKIESFGFKDSEYQNFFTENEIIELNYIFSDFDKGDIDQSAIKWYLNGFYQSQYDNLTQISSSITYPGQFWYAEILAFDGEGTGSFLSTETMFIEDIPDFNDFGFNPVNDTEGHYEFWFNVTAKPANPIGNDRATITLDIIINSSESHFVIAEWNNTHYVYDWQYSNYSMIGSEILIIAEGSTRVNYKGITYLISEYVSFNFTFLDNAPPRVKNVLINFDSDQNPSEITFTVEIEEFGSEIQNATLYYLFQSPSDAGTARFKYTQNLEEFTKVDLVRSNQTFYYVTVDFNSGDSVNILYQIQISDQSGNLNLNAWPDGTDPDKLFQYNPPLLNFTPEELGLFALVVFIVVLLFSFLLNKKFRSKELVGLDKESVIKNIHKLKEQDITDSIDLHTLGVVISFFDQRQGPIPVLYQPLFLRDNYNKLLELSDISFSTGRFVENFTDEEQSSFTFSFDPNSKIKVLSYSFSLNRPESRGGAENLILKIMLPTEAFPLISQFGNQIKNVVFRIHRILDADLEGKDKEKVSEMLNEIRELVASIALSHIDLYGTLELETDDNSDNK